MLHVWASTQEEMTQQENYKFSPIVLSLGLARFRVMASVIKCNALSPSSC